MEMITNKKDYAVAYLDNHGLPRICMRGLTRNDATAEAEDGNERKTGMTYIVLKIKEV